MISDANNYWLHNPSRGFFTLCRINFYGLECFRWVCPELFSRVFLTLQPYSWDFTRIIFMVHHPCTSYIVNSRRDLWWHTILCFFYARNFWAFVCHLLLTLDWHCACQCKGNKIKGTIMWRNVLEAIILVITVNHTGD